MPSNTCIQVIGFYDIVPFLYSAVVLVVMIIYLAFPNDEWFQSLLISHGQKPIFADAYLVQGKHNTWPPRENITMYSEEYCDQKFTVDEEKMHGIKMMGSSWITVNPESTVSHYRDICRFQAVGKDYIFESDVRSVNFLSSASPVFLLCSVIILSLLPLIMWRSSIVPPPEDDERNKPSQSQRIFTVVYVIICIIWLVQTLANQNMYKIAYNNYIVVCILAIYLFINTKAWSVPAPTVADSAVPRKADSPEKQALFPESKKFSQMKLKMPFKYDWKKQEYDDINPTTIWWDLTGEKKKKTQMRFLAEKRMLASPLSIIASFCLSLMMAASLFSSGSYWMYTEIFYATLFVFISTYMCVNTAIITANEEIKEQTAKEEEKKLKYICGLTHFLFTLYTVVYIGSVMGSADRTQETGDFANPIICLIAFALYNIFHLAAMIAIITEKGNVPAYFHSVSSEIVFVVLIPLCSALMVLIIIAT